MACGAEDRQARADGTGDRAERASGTYGAY